ncbi:MAG: FHA domain-containing protein [Planctomycetota bacterium]
MLILIIAGGPDKGRIYELLEGKPVVLGREGDQVSLNDRKCSREHARLWCEGGQWYLEDLGSRHGTFRNHARLEADQRAKIKDGDYLQIGNTVMVMGRMPGEFAERAALLSETPAQAGTVPRKRPGALIALGLTATAAIIGLGGYLVFEMQSLKSQSVDQDDYAQLRQDLLDTQQQANRANQDLQRALSDEAAMRREFSSETRRLTDALGTTGEAIDRHNDALADASEDIRDAARPISDGLAQVNRAAEQNRLALAQLSETLAAQSERDNSEQVLAQIEAIKTQLAGQPSTEELVAQLERAIATNAEATGQAVQRAIAAATDEDAQLAAAERTEALVLRVLGELEKLPSADQIAADVRIAVAEGRAANEQFMRDVLVELRRTGDRISTDVIAAIDEDAGYAQALLDQVMTELAKQPTGEQLAEQLRLAVAQTMQQGRPGNDQALAGLMQQVLTELEQRPTSEQLAADLRVMIGSDAQRTERMMTPILAELDNRPTAGQIASELRSVDNEAAARTAALLEQVLTRMDEQAELAQQIDELKQAIADQPEPDARLGQQILRRLDAQALNNDRIVAAIAELREAMPGDVTGQLDQMLAKLDEQVRADQLNAAIESAVARVAATEDQAVLAAIDSLSERIAALPSADQLEEVLDSQSELAELLDGTDARAAIGELRAALDRLAQARPQGDADPQLTQIIEMLRKREQADLLLAEMHDMLERQPEQAERMRRQVLTAIEEAGRGDTDLLLQQLLDEVRTRLANDEAIREAVESAMHGTVIPGQRALQDAHEIATDPNQTPVDDPGIVTSPRPTRLTDLEQAYKQAFETGRPVTVGAGTVDPTSGRVSEGRRIDPSVAKALGFENWRDWYLTDLNAERSRIQRDAQRQRNDAERDKPQDIVTLPGPSSDQ